MTKTYFQELAQYNIWANNKIGQWLSEISLPQWQQPLVGSFESVAATTLHIVAAEKIWFERLQKSPRPWLSHVFEGNREELLELWKISSNHLLEFVERLPEVEFEQKFSFKNLRGEPFNMRHYEALAHVFNHSTYHRGQLVNYLRQVGFAQVTSTDLINFYRES